MTDDALAPRPVRDSQSEMAEIVLPNDANPLAALLGGRLMHWIDLAGAMASQVAAAQREWSIAWRFCCGRWPRRWDEPTPGSAHSIGG